MSGINERIRQIAVPVLGALVVGYFAYHSMKGDHGLNAYIKLSGELAKAEEVLQERRSKREVIEHRTNLLRPDNLDLDILDERARDVLNLLNVNERVIFD
ncbi:MAG: septum formation initiator family protein [Pseudomonadota bacterium]|nr:septum formation initiator family protein [Pseudomonadota bacterium]